MNRLIWILIALIASSALVQGEAKVPIRDHIEVRSAKITLRDLVRADVELSESDQSISPAPAPGSTRVLSRHELESLLLADRVNPLRFAIPEQVVVSRWSRCSTQSELRDAVAKALEQQKIDVSLAGSLRGTGNIGVGDPILIVSRIEISHALNVIRFRMKVTNEPELHEFWVTSQLSEENAEVKDLSLDLRAKSALRSHPRPSERAPILTKTMKPASLVVYGRGFQFTTSVVPLENGALGQTIRVREEGTGRILKAEVTGPSQLQIGQQLASNQ